MEDPGLAGLDWYSENPAFLVRREFQALPEVLVDQPGQAAAEEADPAAVADSRVRVDSGDEADSEVAAEEEAPEAAVAALPGTAPATRRSLGTGGRTTTGLPARCSTVLETPR